MFSQQLTCSNHRIFKQLAKALIRLRLCGGGSEALLVEHTTLLEISCRGSIMSRVPKRTVQLSIHNICFEYPQPIFWLSFNTFFFCYALIMKALVLMAGPVGSCVAVKAECVIQLLPLYIVEMTIWLKIFLLLLVVFRPFVQPLAHLDHVLHKLYRLFGKHA